MQIKALVDLALVGRAVAEVAVVVVGEQRLGVHRRHPAGPADRLEPDLVGLRGALGVPELGPQQYAQVPQRAGDDQPVLVRLADQVVGPAELLALRVDLAQGVVRRVEEEARSERGVVGDRRAQVVGDALTDRPVEAADPGNEPLLVHGVAKLVIDDVADPPGVLAAIARLKEVDRVAVGERVAGAVDVDRHL